MIVATKKQRVAARANIKKAAAAAKKKRTIAHLSSGVRTALGKKGAAAARKSARDSCGIWAPPVACG
jgi:hypothetical protein